MITIDQAAHQIMLQFKKQPNWMFGDKLTSNAIKNGVRNDLQSGMLSNADEVLNHLVEKRFIEFTPANSNITEVSLGSVAYYTLTKIGAKYLNEHS